MVTIMDHREGCRTEEIVEDPMTVPQRLMEGWIPQRLDELPEAFCGKRSAQIIYSLYQFNLITTPFMVLVMW